MGAPPFLSFCSCLVGVKVGGLSDWTEGLGVKDLPFQTGALTVFADAIGHVDIYG